MSIIPCAVNPAFVKRIELFATELAQQAHLVGSHGLDEREFIDSGLFRASIERLRGQFSATMVDKRDFITRVLNHLQDLELILGWDSAGEHSRHDYSVDLPSGRTAIIEIKGCLDGNNTNIFERPANADEFFIWSLCSNPGSNPKKNVWSGIHTRLSTEIITRQQRVDGLIVWDWICGTAGRPCPKLTADPTRVTSVGRFMLPPPCIYLFPATIPHPKHNPNPPAQAIARTEFLNILHLAFQGVEEELNHVSFEVEYKGDTMRRATTVMRHGVVQMQSQMTAIRRV